MPNEALNYNYRSTGLFNLKYACSSGLRRILYVQFSFVAIQGERLQSIFSTGIVFISLNQASVITYFSCILHISMYWKLFLRADKQNVRLFNLLPFSIQPALLLKHQTFWEPLHMTWTVKGINNNSSSGCGRGCNCNCQGSGASLQRRQIFCSLVLLGICCLSLTNYHFQSEFSFYLFTYLFTSKNN